MVTPIACLKAMGHAQTEKSKTQIFIFNCYLQVRYAPQARLDESASKNIQIGIGCVCLIRQHVTIGSDEPKFITKETSPTIA
ncbi:MAG: hypothetical protein KC443_22230, partial [Anaerolineales bacterium]|nr:hypothetical protein [Anaerolineales bacterium]